MSHFQGQNRPSHHSGKPKFGGGGPRFNKPLPENSIKENRVYIGNLPFSVRNPDLEQFMSSAGTVVYVDVFEMANGMSKGCGIVEFLTREDAVRALETLNEKELNGRKVFVREDRDDGAAPANAGASTIPAAASTASPSSEEMASTNSSEQVQDQQEQTETAAPSRSLYVGNLDYSVSWQELKDHFRPAGNVVRADIFTGRDGRSRGQGTVVFDSVQSAEKAIEMYHGQSFRGRNLDVRFDRYPDRPASAYSQRQGFNAHSGSGSSSFGSGGFPSQPNPNSKYFQGNHGGFHQAPSHFPSQRQHQQPQQHQQSGENSSSEGNRRIYVGNLPFQASWQDLKDFFNGVGNVVRADILFSNGRPRGAGIVVFESPETAELAITQLNGQDFKGRNIEVRYDRYA